MRRQPGCFYGWIVVATSALGLLFGAFPIVVSSFAIFFQSYTREFHASRAAISLALSIHNFMAACLAAWIGRLADRFGARNLILPGLGMLGLVLLGAKAIGSKVWQLYIFYAMLGVVSDMTTTVPYGVVVSRWFSRRRGLALGLMMAGLGVGSIVMPPVVQSLIAGYGWRAAFAIVGGAVLIIPMPIVGLLLKEAPPEMSMLPDGVATAAVAPGEPEGLTWREVRTSTTFWLMIAAFVLASGSIGGCVAHIAQLFADRGGTAGLAALTVSVVGLAMLTGRAGAGFFLDRYFGPHVAIIVFALAALGIALLWAGGAGVSALTGAFLVGLGLGAEMDILAYLLGRYFGLRSLGTAFGFGFGALILAAGAGPLIMGAAFDRTGSYCAPLAGCFFAAIVAAALVARLGPYRFATTREAAAPAQVHQG